MAADDTANAKRDEMEAEALVALVSAMKFFKDLLTDSGSVEVRPIMNGGSILSGFSVRFKRD
jgi:hypothetical protein